jgi:hypothetical protein
VRLRWMDGCRKGGRRVGLGVGDAGDWSTATPGDTPAAARRDMVTLSVGLSVTRTLMATHLHLTLVILTCGIRDVAPFSSSFTCCVCQGALGVPGKPVVQCWVCAGFRHACSFGSVVMAWMEAPAATELRRAERRGHRRGAGGAKDEAMWRGPPGQLPASPRRAATAAAPSSAPVPLRRMPGVQSMLCDPGCSAVTVKGSGIGVTGVSTPGMGREGRFVFVLAMQLASLVTAATRDPCDSTGGTDVVRARRVAETGAAIPQWAPYL